MNTIIVTATNYTQPIGTVINIKDLPQFDIDNKCYLSEADKLKEKSEPAKEIKK